MAKYLVVNADDFGMCQGVNDGIIKGHKEGIITSTTLMANGEAFENAITQAKMCPNLSVGCHLVLIGGRPTTNPKAIKSLLGSDGDFTDSLEKLVWKLTSKEIKKEEVIIEFSSQVEKIKNAGLHVSHLDSHKHSHVHPLILEAVLEVAEKYNVAAIRNPFESLWSSLFYKKPKQLVTFVKQQVSKLGLIQYAKFFKKQLTAVSIPKTPDHFWGFAHTGLLTDSFVIGLIEILPEGVNELMCHPAIMDNTLYSYKTRLKESRVAELDVMVSSEVKKAINEFKVNLVNYIWVGKRA